MSHSILQSVLRCHSTACVCVGVFTVHAWYLLAPCCPFWENLPPYLAVAPLLVFGEKDLSDIWPWAECPTVQCTLYNRRRQHCLFTNWEAVVPSKKTKWLAFSASHIWIQTCTLLPNVYISPPFDHTLICSDRARAIHPHLWRQICHFGQIFEFRSICQGKSSLKRHTRHLLLHNRLADNFIWRASKDKNVIVSVNRSIYRNQQAAQCEITYNKIS